MSPHDALQPSAWVRRFAPLIAGGGRVLDLACGSGRHTVLLAKLGYRVLALDRDAATLARVRGAAALLRPGDAMNGAVIELMQSDVEAGPWPFGAAQFDGVIVTNYLHRKLLPRLSECLRPGGVLIYETFAAGNQRHGRPTNPDYLLAKHELLQCFMPALSVLAFEQGLVEAPGMAVVQRICALRTTDWASAPIPAGLETVCNAKGLPGHLR